MTWIWSGQTASAFEVAWRARGDDDGLPTLLDALAASASASVPE